jgi:predicted dinucleotide-binding enzyme
MPLTRVAIIGAGGVGNALAGRLIAGGKDVCFGVRRMESDSAKKTQDTFPSAKVTTIPEAADWCGVH